MDTLKTELLQSQKTRDDLMKWKLLLVSGIGSTALGFSGTKGFVHAEPALCLIPFACCYTDLLCRNLSIRTKLLSAFLSAEVSLSPQDPTARFEGFYQDFEEARRQQDVQGQKWRLRDALEGLALVYSTRILSLAVMPIGIYAYYGGSLSRDNWLQWPSLLFLISGLGGICLSWIAEREYEAQESLIQSRKAEKKKASAHEQPSKIIRVPESEPGTP